MIGEFTVLPVREAEYEGVIVCNNYYSPINYICDLNSELQRVNIKGLLIIDLLLVNGAGPSRFAECLFDGQKIDLKSIRAVKDAPSEIKSAITAYFSDHYAIIENSILTRAVKSNFKKKLAA